MQDVQSPLLSSPLQSPSQVYHLYLLIFFLSSCLLPHSLFSHSFHSLPKFSSFHFFVLSYSFSTSVSLFFSSSLPFPSPSLSSQAFLSLHRSFLFAFLVFIFTWPFLLSISRLFQHLFLPFSSPPFIFLSLLIFLIYVFHISFLCIYLFINFPNFFFSSTLLPFSPLLLPSLFSHSFFSLLKSFLFHLLALIFT